MPSGPFKTALFALFVLSILSPSSRADDLLNIDVSGSDGADAADGSNGRTGSPNGAYRQAGGRGTPGGDAGEAEVGEGAGQILVQLEPKRDAKGKVIPGEFQVVIHSIDPKKQVKDLNRDLLMGDFGNVELRARGGIGGDGGSGGTGGTGGRGGDGADASRFSSGENGRRGGDGGPGGRGTNGQAGGRGGEIQIRVPEDSTHLLMLTNTDIEGGNGGAQGTHGNGGPGGGGGDGGSSYTWTESTTRTRTVSDGNGGSRTETYTDYETHTNPGGSDGSSGNTGSRHSFPLSAGINGRTGKLEILVARPGGGVRSYKSPYDLKLVDFEYSTPLGDGILEPGRTGAAIRNLRIRNTGDMPTPPNYPITLDIDSLGLIESENRPLTIPRALKPGETYVFNLESIPFAIRDVKYPSVDQRFVSKESLSPQARMDAAQRYFMRFPNPKDVEATFPIQISEIRRNPSLSAGESTKVLIHLDNISTKDYGSESELARSIAVNLEAQSPEIAKYLIYRNKHGQEILLAEGLAEEVKRIQRGGRTTVEGTITVAQNAPPYIRLPLVSTLRLGDPGEVGFPSRAIQMQNTDVRVGLAYDQKTPGDVLLIVNHSTEQEELPQWLASIRKLGLEPKVWDISLNGHLKLSEALEKGSNLIQDFAGKTVVVLNNPFDSNTGTVKAEELLRDREFLKAAFHHDTKFIFANQDRDPEALLRSKLVPKDYETLSTRPTTLKSVDDFYDKQGDKKGFASLEDPGVGVHIDLADSWKFGREPSYDYLNDYAEEVQQELTSQHPDRRYVVTPKFAPKRTADGYIWDSWKVGSIDVRRTLDGDTCNALSWDLPEGKFHDKAEIEKKAELALLEAMTFERKLKMLKDILENRGVWKTTSKKDRAATLSRLTNAIILELSAEQGALYRNNDKLKKKVAKTKLDSLETLSKFTPDKKVDPTSADGAELEKIIAAVEFLSWQQLTWWNSIMPWPFSNTHIRKQSLRMINEFKENALLYYGDGKWWTPTSEKTAMKKGDAKIAAYRAQFTKSMKALFKKDDDLSYRAASLDVLNADSEAEGIVHDCDLMQDITRRLITEGEYQELKDEEEAHRKTRKEFWNTHAEDQRRLGIGESPNR